MKREPTREEREALEKNGWTSDTWEETHWLHREHAPVLAVGTEKALALTRLAALETPEELAARLWPCPPSPHSGVNCPPRNRAIAEEAIRADREAVRAALLEEADRVYVNGASHGGPAGQVLRASAEHLKPRKER